jgi:iron complex outermembrane receptor protein
MNSTRTSLLSSTIIAGVMTMVLTPTLAFAQDAQTDQASAPAEVEELVVTGSRIKRNEFTSAAPIQVITSEQAELRGIGDTTAFLQSSTLASGSTQINSTISSAFVIEGGPGSTSISLRGLGANRTLVLLNGKRAGPAGTRGQVSAFDLNVIPESVIDRVEILKDGASSIYGSDAIAGVVNIITKRETDGVDLDIFGGVPIDGGGDEYSISATWGKKFDRGFLTISGEYYKQNPLRLGDRDYLSCPQQYIRAVGGGRFDTIDPRTGKPACLGTTYGQIYVYDGNTGAPARLRLQYDGTGQIGQLVPGSIVSGPNNPYDPTDPDSTVLGAPANFFFVGGPVGSATQGVSNQNSKMERDSYLIPETTRSTIYASGEFELNSHITAYGDVLLNRRETDQVGFRQFWTYTFGEDGGDPFSAGFTGNYFYSPTVGTPTYDNTKVDYMRFVGGFKGDFGGVDFLQGWDWDIYVQHSRSKGEYGGSVILDDAVKSAEGRSDTRGSFGIFNDNSIPRLTASCVGLVTPISNRPCIDIPWMDPRFLAGDLTPEEKAFLFDYETGHTTYTQTYVEGTTTGNLFNLPAGPVGVALGFQLRREEIHDTPGSITLSGNSWNSSGAGITKGKDTTKEVFGELNIPLLKDFTFVKSLNLSLSGRYTDVDSYGSNSTYKAGLDWQINSQFRVRATHGTSFRAPGLYELYLADQTGFLSNRQVDPCINYAQGLDDGTISQAVATNCAADGIPGDYTGAPGGPTIISGGGAGVLKAETSKATTFGIVWTPEFADFSIAVDYFDIEIADEVTKLGANNILYQCYNSTSFPTDPLCAQFSRNPQTLGILEVRDSFLNVAEQSNRGLDLTVRYRTDIPWGKLTFDGQFTWQFEDKTALFADTEIDANGSVGDPDFTGIVTTQFDRGPWTVNWAVNMIGKASSARFVAQGNGAGTYLYKVHTEFTAYHSLSLRYRFSDWSLLAGVSNVFDEPPPAVTTLDVGAFGLGTVGYSVLGSQYDYLGRRAFFKISKKF